MKNLKRCKQKKEIKLGLRIDTTGMMKVESSYSNFISGDQQAIRMQSLTSRVTQTRSVQKTQAGDTGKLAPMSDMGRRTGRRTGIGKYPR